MRKMTKMAVTLAAMSAMTVAAASMTLAVDDGWNGSTKDGWSYYKDGVKVTGWAEIDGVWYYFDKSGDMAQEELVYISGETYYFNADGSMMANGWVGFEKDSDVLYDYDLDIDENIDDIRNKVFKNVEDAYETVWMYFYTDGTAADDEWLPADSGLWYRFDDIVMVCGDYDHEIGNKRYGFAEDGHMFVGWEQNYVDKGITAPNSNEKTWYYYDSDGTKFDAQTADDVNFGWKKIDGKWYCFQAKGEESDQQYSVGTLITKAFFTNSKTAGGNSEYYYVDSNGVMATGVTTVDKGAKVVDGTYGWSENTGKLEKYVSSNWDVYFNNDGKAQSNKWSGDRYYAGAESDKVMTLGLEDDFELAPYADASVAVTGNKADDKTAADIKGALVKNAFITGSDVFYVDKYGDKVTSSAVQVGYVTVKKEVVEKKDKYTSSTGFEVFTDEAIAEGKAATGEIVCKAYVVLNNKGIAYDDVDEGRTASAGSKKYLSTGLEYLENAQLFYYYNKN